MAYVGNTPTTQNFISGTDYFNGTGSQTAFTLSRTVASVNDIQAVVNNVVQVPNDAYTISGTTITFTSAPSAGTQNVYVRYLSTTTQAITPSQNTVSWNTLDSNTQQDLGLMYKNKIINGNMVIDQRNAGASLSMTTSTYGLDRYRCFASQTSKMTVQRNAGSVTPPTGFTNYMGFTSSSAYSSLSTDRFMVIQGIEGYNIADLGWGTANAKTVTVSFWVRSSLTGTHSGALGNDAGSRSYVFSFTISSANTWEYKTVTIVGETSGTWLTDNQGGIYFYFNLGCGSNYLTTAGSWANGYYIGATGANSVVGTNGATFYVTGLQLEVGTQATAFSTAGGSYGAELALCQRYYYKWLNDSAGDRYIANTQAYSTTGAYGKLLDLPVPMRTAPTCSRSGTFRIDNASSGSAGNPSTVQLDNITRFSIASGDIKGGVSGLVAGNCAAFSVASNGYIDASAEL